MEDFLKIKKNQLKQYEEKCGDYLKLSETYQAISMVKAMGVLVLMAFLAVGEATLWVTFACYLVLGLTTGGALFFWRLKEHALKSAILLDELGSELSKALQYIGDPDYMLERVLAIETMFLANDDEFYTKKFLWRPFLNHMEEKLSEEKGIPELIEVPTVWMDENPLKNQIEASDFVNLNWQIKRGIRQLYTSNYQVKYETLTELGKLAQRNPIVFERFLRNKKISKLLKNYKTGSHIFYLNAAAKMKLITFVDTVLEKRPEMEQCIEMNEFVHEKNVQIQKYTTDFWNIHRRSIKFYVIEFLWLTLMVPVVIASLFTKEMAGVIPAALLFFVGTSVVVYGEMILVTRQLIDLKSKKLTPSLIASLMAIRHSMCSAAEADQETVKTYQRYFKVAEKRFMLTTTEVEAVKYVKENVTEKVMKNLQNETLQLRQEKDKQAQVYYEKFNHYRRQCLKYGVLEAFVALMIIPVYFIAYEMSVTLGLDVMDEMIDFGTFGLAIITEAILINRHIRVARRKELFLLIYQKMSVILSDYTIFSDQDRLRRELSELEESIITATESDELFDVSSFIQTQTGPKKTVDILNDTKKIS